MDNQQTTFKTLAQVEKEYILEVLESVGGSKAKAAAVLGVTIKTVYNKLNRYAAESKPVEEVTEPVAVEESAEVTETVE